MIVVVGAGIAGLAAALALAEFADVTVVERRSADAANGGAGIQLSPNALKALDGLSLRDRVVAVADRPEALVIRSVRRREPLARVCYGAAFARRYGAPSLTVARATLHGTLLRAASVHPAIEVRFGETVTAFERTSRGWRLPGHGFVADLVVAADGVRSDVRRRLVGDEALATRWTAWRARGTAGEARATRLTLSRGKHLVRYPAGPIDNCVLVCRSAPERGASLGSRTARNATPRRDPSAGAQGDLPTVTASDPMLPQLADIDGWEPWPISVFRRHVWRGDRLALVGDAAHATVPFLAQGGAMALEDAAVLRAAVARHGVGDEALAVYERVRRSRLTRVARQSVRQGAIYHLGGTAAAARDAAIATLGERGVLAQVDWIYRWRPDDPAGCATGR